jgi:hypothetical protein
LRAGFTDRFELGLELPLKLVSYASDPVILLSTPLTGEDAFDFYQRNVIDLSQTRQGVGDVWISGRYNLLRTAVAIALEGRIKLPAGYDGPQGTFGDDPATIEDFNANVATVTSPDNISDDVALGDGQIDMNVNALFGVSFPSRTFMRLDTGYNLRVSAGDQVLASFKVGQSIGSRVLVYADARLAYTVTRGPRIGVSVAAIDPNVPAADYVGLNNLRLRELRLERDALDVTVGGIVRLNERSEINLGYSRTLWGRNTAAVNAFFVGIGIRTDASPDEPEAAEEAHEQPQDEGDIVEEEHGDIDALSEEAPAAVAGELDESAPTPSP